METNSADYLGTEKLSNNAAELEAIYRAAHLAENNINIIGKVLEIRYDSKYAATLAQGKSQPHRNIALASTARAKTRYLKSLIKVRFIHVKGHSNDYFNDEADAAADKGASGLRSESLSETSPHPPAATPPPREEAEDPLGWGGGLDEP